ncbi:unnamed protein product, partial [Protopolystoma xenopodis]
MPSHFCVCGENTGDPAQLKFYAFTDYQGDMKSLGPKRKQIKHRSLTSPSLPVTFNSAGS